MYLRTLFVLYLSIFVCIWRECNAQIPAAELQALLDIYDQCNGFNWINQWNPYGSGSGNPCSPVWYGIVCNGPPTDQHIFLIQLAGNGLTKTIPSSIGAFSQLQLLDLSINQMTGTIPESLYSLTNLEQLYLQENAGLSGTISNSIGKLSLLTQLDLSSDSLSGTLPSSLYSLTNLKYLSLSDNTKISGTISSNLGSLTQLTNLYMASLSLTGSIPTSVGSLTNILQLQLLENQLTGTIPSFVCNLTSLTGLWLNNNAFTGSIPPCLSQLTKLQYLYLSNNKLTGNIPESIYTLPNLSNLFVGGNAQLGGTISTSVGNLGPNILELDLSQAGLTGTIPTEIGQLTGLNYLNIGTNYLTGTLPAAIGNMRNLTNFIALSIPQSTDRLTGAIPDGIWQLPNLQVLMLGTNKFNNTLPSVFGNPNLQQVDISSNMISGSIPESLYNCTQLTLLKLSSNQISGTISPLISNLVNLQQLALNNNQLTGFIPPFFQNSSKLTNPPGTVLEGNPFFCPISTWAHTQTGATCQLWAYTSIKPDHGPFNTLLTITGSHFSLDVDLVCDWEDLGTTPVVFANSTTIVCETPSVEDFAARSVNMEILFENNPVNSSSAVSFYLYGTPFIYDVEPNTGRQQGRTNVTISGRNFAATDRYDELLCSFNGTIVPGTYFNDSIMFCTTPQSDPGDSFITVSNNGNTSFIAEDLEFYYFPYCDGFPVCSDNGLCNTSLLVPECVCDLNFDQHICNSCVPLFFGEYCLACPVCGSYGVCDDGLYGSGKCVCQHGFYGKICKPCPACQHGTCADGEAGSGLCVCHIGYGGALCDSLWKVYAGIGGIVAALLIALIVGLCIRRRIRQKKGHPVEEKPKDTELEETVGDEKGKGAKIEENGAGGAGGPSPKDEDPAKAAEIAGAIGAIGVVAGAGALASAGADNTEGNQDLKPDGETPVSDGSPKPTENGTEIPAENEPKPQQEEEGGVKTDEIPAQTGEKTEISEQPGNETVEPKTPNLAQSEILEGAPIVVPVLAGSNSGVIAESQSPVLAASSNVGEVKSPILTAGSIPNSPVLTASIPNSPVLAASIPNSPALATSSGVKSPVLTPPESGSKLSPILEERDQSRPTSLLAGSSVISEVKSPILRESQGSLSSSEEVKSPILGAPESLDSSIDIHDEKDN